MRVSRLVCGIDTYSRIIGLVVVLLWAGGASANTLGTAANFAVLGGSTVTNTGSSVVDGNLGVSPGSAITGFPPGIVIAPGAIHASDAAAGQAQNDLTVAYNALLGLGPTENLSNQDLGGKVLLPGVYKFSSSAELTGILTLDAQGSDQAVWVFQIGGTLTTASGAVVQVVNGGPDDGVFWQIGSSATLGTNTVFEGNILADQSITLTTGVLITCGRALAEHGAVTLDTNVVSTACVATPGWAASQATELSGVNGNLGTGLNSSVSSVPEPGSVMLILIGLMTIFRLSQCVRTNQSRPRSNAPAWHTPLQAPVYDRKEAVAANL